MIRLCNYLWHESVASGVRVTVRHDVDESNAVQADHLLEIDIAPLVRIDVLTERKTEVRAV